MKSTFKAVLLCMAAVLTLACTKKARTIASVPEITVQAPQGTAPVLPWQVWVNYADGTGEWRQVKWTNTLRETEEEEAGLPAGETYTVKGYVIGDNSAENGYPLEAQVTVVAEKPKAPNIAAQPLPLGDVRLIGNNRRFGCGFRPTENGARQYYAFYGFPNRNSDYFYNAQISLEEFLEIERKYFTKKYYDGKGEDFYERYVKDHTILLEGEDNKLIQLRLFRKRC